MAIPVRELRTLTLQQVVTAALLEGVDPEVFGDAQRALNALVHGKGRVTTPKRILIDGICAKRRATHTAGDRLRPTRRRCDANARKGTGTGMCDAPLDEHGNCPNAGNHID